MVSRVRLLMKGRMPHPCIAGGVSRERRGYDNLAKVKGSEEAS
jgi:hypothetical protein